MKTLFILFTITFSSSTFAGYFKATTAIGYGNGSYACCSDAQRNAKSQPNCREVKPSSVNISEVCPDATSNSQSCYTNVTWFCDEENL